MQAEHIRRRAQLQLDYLKITKLYIIHLFNVTHLLFSKIIKEINWHLKYSRKQFSTKCKQPMAELEYVNKNTGPEEVCEKKIFIQKNRNMWM